MSRVVRSMAILFVFIAGPLAVLSQNAPQATAVKPTLTKEDYKKFESLSGSTLSADGKWIAYVVSRGERGANARGRGSDNSSAVHYRATAANDEKVVTSASNPMFTSNNKWMLYTVTPAGEAPGGQRAGGGGGRGGQRGGGERGAGASAGASSSIGVIDLASGTTTLVQDVQSYILSSDGHHVAFRRAVPEGAQNKGAGLVIRDLETNMDVSWGNVSESAWSDDGTMLAMVIDVAGKTGNGVQVFNTATSTVRSLDTSDMLYSNLRWRKKSDDVAVYRSREQDAGFDDKSYTVLAWKGISSARPSSFTYDFSKDSAFPKDMRVASDMAPQWSEDGNVLVFGIAAREAKYTPPAERGDNPAKVQIWHAKDLREWPQQKNSATQDLARTHMVSWRVADNKIVRLGDEQVLNVQLSTNQKLAIGTDETPFFMDIVSGRQYHDIY